MKSVCYWLLVCIWISGFAVVGYVIGWKLYITFSLGNILLKLIVGLPVALGAIGYLLWKKYLEDIIKEIIDL